MSIDDNVENNRNVRFDKIPIEERPLLMDEEGNYLTEEGKELIDKVFTHKITKGRVNAKKFYDKLDPVAQAYIRNKYLFP